MKAYQFTKRASGKDYDGLPLVSVIVPTLGGRWLRPCLAALGEYCYPQYEVIVVVDRPRKGPGHARNRGLETARGDFVHFIDDDCLASEENLLELVRAFLRIEKEDRSIGGLSGTLVDVTGRGTVCRVSFSLSGLRVTSQESEGITDCVFTGNALFRKKVLKQVDGFDEQISHQFEDIDLSIRIRAKGHRLHAISNATVYHAGRDPRASTQDRQFRHFYASRNYVLLLSKWRSSHYALLVGFGLTLANAALILPSVFIMVGAGAMRLNEASLPSVVLPRVRFEKTLGSLFGLVALGTRMRTPPRERGWITSYVDPR